MITRPRNRPRGAHVARPGHAPTPPGRADIVVASRRHRRLATKRARRRRAGTLFGIVAVVGGVALLGNIGWFYARNAVQGGALLRHEDGAVAAARRTAAERQTAPTCSPLSDASGTPQGLLTAATIALKAPVMGGDADAQLNVAVGHVPGSAWPGQPGTSVLVAHDVTYFSDLGTLGPDAPIDFVTPCATYRYQVTGHQVVAAGSPIYPAASGSTLVLETCYPTDALYFTNQRYLVSARYLGTSPVHATMPVPAAPQAPTVPVPAALASQGLTLDNNDTPLGVEHVTGAPSPAWQESATPFSDEAAALTEYFGAVRSAEQDQPSWWSALAPSVPMSAAGPLVGGAIAGYPGFLDVTLDATGTTFAGATLEAAVTVTGGAAPGTYQLTVLLTDLSGRLLITSWSMIA